MQIDLNCDLGEAFGNYSFGGDNDIIPLITSANIACGFHAGDENVMNETIQLAKNNVGIGAHPGLPDLQGFGRRKMDIKPKRNLQFSCLPIRCFEWFCKIHGARINHVKPHGALYNMGAKNKEIAQAIAQAVYDFDKSVVLVGLSNTLLISEAEALGLRTASEVFADRRYEDDGQLVSRQESDATITNTDEALQQVLKWLLKIKLLVKW